MNKQAIFSKSVLEKPETKRAIRLVKPIDHEHTIRMGYNENPYGMPESVKKAIADSATYGHFYPDFLYHKLRIALADKFDLKEENVIIGEGSSDLINVAGHAFLNEGDEVVLCPTFAAFYDMIEMARAKQVLVPLCENMSYDLDGILKAVTNKTKMVVITNPNNPTGQYVSIDALRNFVEKIREDIVIFIDEAYIDFATASDCKSAVSFIKEYKDRPIVVMRTFSKYYALAGIRIGYMLCSEELAEGIRIVPIPTVSHTAQLAALAALDETEYYEDAKEKIVEGARYLERELEKLGCTVYPTQTNFILYDPHCDYAKVRDMLLEKGIHISIPMMDRVSISTPENNAYFIQCMKEILVELHA